MKTGYKKELGNFDGEEDDIHIAAIQWIGLSFTLN